MNLMQMGAMLMSLTGPLADDGVQERAPIYLQTERVGDDVSVRVIGNAATATEATYTLAVSSGGSGSNRSVQSGRARLEPNRQVTLIDLRIGRVGADWSAKLEVTPAASQAYMQERGPES